MARFIVVANQTLGGERLTVRLAELMGGRDPSDTAVWIVVPVTETDGTHLWDYPPIDRYIPDARSLAQALAQGRLEQELERLRGVGVTAGGEVTDPNPVERVRTLVAQQPCTAVVVATLPRPLSRWLRADLPHRLSRAVDVPVVHVEGDAGPSL